MNDENLGLDLSPGDEHYRAYVGPPQDYDLVSAMVFNLLTVLGCRQHHKVLDVGCGSLRNGRLLIPYLNQGNYTGIEPNQWLIDEGVNNEVGKSLVEIKSPTLLVGDSTSVLNKEVQFDYVFAQSIFSHCGLDLIETWLKGVYEHLNDTGVFAATFLVGEDDFDGKGWVYPGCVLFKPETLESIARDLGFGFKVLDWWHPRQVWCLFYKQGFNSEALQQQPLNWNNSILRLESGHKK